jgi:hypothetical protein
MTRALGALLFASLAATTTAEPARGSVSASYDRLRDHDEREAYPRGFSLSVGVRLHGVLGAKLEASRSTRSADFRSTGGGLFEMRYEALRGGPRVARSGGRVRPYVQTLAGLSRWRIRQRRDPLGDESLLWESVRDFALTPGGGVDLFVARRASVRLGGDLSFLFRRDGRFGNAYRARLSSLHAGVALHWGGG